MHLHASLHFEFAFRILLKFALAHARWSVILRGDNFASRETQRRNAKKPCAMPLKYNSARYFAHAACWGYPPERDSKIFVSIITYPHSEMKRLEKSPSRLLLEGFVNIFLQPFAIYDSALWVRDFTR
jgi:hypothetical protein